MSLDPFTLTSSRLLLHDFVASDKNDVFAFRSDSRTTELMDFPSQSRKESDDWVETVIFHNSQRPRRSFNIAIALKDDDRAVGWIGFGDSSRNSGPGNSVSAICYTATTGVTDSPPKPSRLSQTSSLERSKDRPSAHGPTWTTSARRACWKRVVSSSPAASAASTPKPTNPSSVWSSRSAK